MAGSYCYYPVAGYGQVAEVLGVLAQTVATTYQIYLQRQMATKARHRMEREAAAAQAQAAAQAAAQAKAAQVVGQQANVMAGGGGGVTAALGQVPTWVWLAGAGGVGALLFLSRRR